MRRLLGVLRDDDAGRRVRAATRPRRPRRSCWPRCAWSGLRGELVTEGQPPAQLAPGLQLTVYRLVQEALTNVLKHAVGATVAVVRLTFRHDRLEVEVTDDGAGQRAARARRSRASPACASGPRSTAAWSRPVRSADRLAGPQRIRPHPDGVNA